MTIGSQILVSCQRAGSGSEKEQKLMLYEPRVRLAKQDQQRQSVSSCVEYGEQGGRTDCQGYQGKRLLPLASIQKGEMKKEGNSESSRFSTEQSVSTRIEGGAPGILGASLRRRLCLHPCCFSSCLRMCHISFCILVSGCSLEPFSLSKRVCLCQGELHQGYYQVLIKPFVKDISNSKEGQL